jgi:hypothetical protein
VTDPLPVKRHTLARLGWTIAVVAFVVALVIGVSTRLARNDRAKTLTKSKTSTSVH